MRFLDLALKDLSQLLREKRAFLFLVVMPVAFTLFMGMAYKGGSQDSDPRLVLGWLSQNPTGLASKTLHDLISQSDVVRLRDLDADTTPANIAGQMHNGALAGVLLVPPNFNQQIQKGKIVQITLYTDEYSTNGQSVIQAVRGSLTRLMSSVEITNLVVKSLDTNDDQQRTSIFLDAVAGWKKSTHNNLSYTVEKAEGIGPTVSSLLAENPYKQSSPGILVQFAVFGLVTSAGILVDERKSGTLQRLITTSMTRAEIIAGHMLAMLTIVLMQSALLVAVGQFFLNVDYNRQPLAILLVLVTLGLWVSALGLFIGIVAKDEGQVTLFSLIAMFLFSALGGSWFPMESVGSGFAVAAHLAPSFYAMQGLQNILVRGQDLSSVLLPAAILGLFALLFFGLALWRFSADQQK